jgi:hypothetical protein
MEMPTGGTFLFVQSGGLNQIQQKLHSSPFIRKLKYRGLKIYIYAREEWTRLELPAYQKKL